MAPRLIYISGARLPTDKAHGFQIVKMCEAFSRAGARVELWHRTRGDDDSRGSGELFSFYPVESNFEVRTFSNIDVFRLERRLPGPVFRWLFLAEALKWGRHVVRIARAERADLFYTRDISVAYWLLRCRLPTYYEAHGLPRRARLWPIRHALAGPSLKGAAAVTGYIKDGLIDLGVAEERVSVKADGVDLRMFEGLPSRASCRARFDLPTARPIVGYVGRFQTLGMEKGIGDLIAALGLLKEGHPRPLLLCVGGPMDHVLGYLELTRRAGLDVEDVRFVDRVPNSEVPLWMRACDIGTIPWPATTFSRYYTSPLKLFEYMAAGLPIIATDLPALREVLRHGDNSWLVASDDASDLARGIARLLGDPPLREKLAAHARADVGRYTWDDRAAQILRASAV